MRFAHIADTHIRNLKYHYEYKEVFKQLYESLRKEKVEYIIHCGDIAHTKTQISPEFVEMCSNFLSDLASIAPTYVILGNHDGNLKNSSRQDALTPIVDALDNPNLRLLKESQEVSLGHGFNLNVLSVFDEDNWTTPSDKEEINIALYHGAIDRSKTDLNWTLSGDHCISIFDDFDFAFLGDIHKTQTLDKRGRIRYCGSTIQQNFGESLDKGYLVWDIKDKEDFTVKHIIFDNPKPFITIPLTKAGNLPRKLKINPGARIRLTSDNNISLDKMRKSVDVVKHKFKPETVTYLNRASSQNVEVSDGVQDPRQENLRDVKVQERLMKGYLKDYEISENLMKKVLELNSSYNVEIEEKEDVYRNVNWSLRRLEWDNLFNYGESNSIDFDKLEGIVGIFGKNFSGKSSIIDALLYTLYNSTSKSVRKNLNIVNQNKDYGLGIATLQVGDKTLRVERNSEKYVKKLKGVETMEAKTEVDFTSVDLLGNEVSKNGLSRQDTDKNIRKHFGSLDDFLMTSMASQLESLTFINEGSTRRKEILAKFLDLEIFDKKFKRAKEDSADTRGALRKIEGTNFDVQISEAQSKLEFEQSSLESNKNRCEVIERHIGELQNLLNEVDGKISSIPAEVVDPVLTGHDIQKFTKEKTDLESEQAKIEQLIAENKATINKIKDFLSGFDIGVWSDKKKTLEEKSEILSNFLLDLEKEEDTLSRNEKKKGLLLEVPCGNEYSNCRFIKDAHKAVGLIDISSKKIKDLKKDVESIQEEIVGLEPEKVNSYIEKYDKVLEKRSTQESTAVALELSLEKNKNNLLKTKSALDDLNERMSEYSANKESIEQLEVFLEEKKNLENQIDEKTTECKECQESINNQYRTIGSLEEKVVSLEAKKQELEDLRLEFAAYDLFMRCCHTNGISYNIIKNRLPIINEEVAKILTGIVDFEVFIQNEDKKLDIFIKHPKYEPRPLEMGSGAEKTIASMAIRLAFLTVSNLPKPDLFIMDEPGTALDEDNMEGFVRIMEMVKNYFKTVILISHLDALKDAVDMQVVIDRKDGFAHVNL